ncbi:unnamed protein product, partial [Iphiclides podalirius]
MPPRANNQQISVSTIGIRDAGQVRYVQIDIARSKGPNSFGNKSVKHFAHDATSVTGWEGWGERVVHFVATRQCIGT